MNFSNHNLSSLSSAARGGARWRRWLAVGALLVAAAVLAQFPLRRAQAQAQSQSQVGALHGAAALDRLQQDGQYESLQAAMEQARFSVKRADATPLGRWAWHAPNQSAGYDAYITEAGVSIALDDKNYVSLHLRSLGYGAALQGVAMGEVSGDKQAITINRQGGLREWFVNGPDGLEHGFTLSEPPAGARQKGVPLRLALQVSAGWQAVESEDGQRVTLCNGKDQAIEYGKLVVRDKPGRNIPARLTVADEQVVIEVEDHDAQYPLTIDPLFTLQQKLRAADGAAYDYFGNAVAVSGNTAVVGAPGDDVTGGNQGTVYVFVRQGATWAQQARLNALDGAANDEFGIAVALDGDTLAVGAPFDDSDANRNQGSVYVFARNGTAWTQQQKLTANDGAADDEFGYAVALSGNTVVVGAWQDDIGANLDQGSVYVFARNGTAWTEQQKLTAADGAAMDFFGYAVALDGDTLAAGAYSDDVGANKDQGSAYVFTHSGDTWTQRQKLTANDGGAQDYLGGAISLGGDTLVVGAYGSDSGANLAQGSAYVFTRNGTTWTQQQKLTASDGAATDHFGYTVALSGDTVVVGAPYDDIGANNEQGSAYVFARNGTAWTQQRKLFAADGRRGDFFGLLLALHQDTVMAGAYADIGGSTDQGAAYVFVVSEQHLERQKLTADDGAANDYFGTAVALDGDTLAIRSGQNGGEVYVFARADANWTLQQELTARDGVAGDAFGFSLALSGDTLAVGAPAANIGTNLSQGAAYVFTRTGTVWTEQQKLFASDGARGDEFGWSVALSGDTVAVGAHRAFVNGANAGQGAVYVFTRNGAAQPVWTQQQKLAANDGAASDGLGKAVALDGDTLVAGASGDDNGANEDQGAAYVFTRTGAVWTQQQKLTANDGTADDYFGYAVALNADTVVVSAPDDNNERGSAYVFVRSGTSWTQQQQLTASDGATEDFFGSAVALGGDTVVVGASGDAIGGGLYQGSVYVFTRAGVVWTQRQKLTASDGATDDGFGGVVALSGDTVMAGAASDDIGTRRNQGSVYVFVSPPCPALALAPASLPGGASGASYQQAITVSGGAGTYQFSLAGGALPPGLTLASNGLLSGTPMTPGAYAFTLSATDPSSLCAASQAYTLTITPPCPPLTILPETLPSGATGAAYSQSFTATGGTTPYSFAVVAGALPPGLSLSAGGSLSGAPTEAGNFNFTLRISDANGCATTRALTLTINAAVITCVSAASYKAGAAPESIVAAFGAQLAAQTQAAVSLPLPTELAGVSVRIRDSQGIERLAPLFFVSPGQINLQIPAGTATGTATISLSNGATGQLEITSTAPGLFAANADGQGVPAAVALRVAANGAQSYEPVARLEGNRFVPAPIDLGPDGGQVFLVLYGTGLRFQQTVSASIGGAEANVLFAGAAAGFAGLDQVNVLVPRALVGRGEVDVTLRVDGVIANTVRISVR